MSITPETLNKINSLKSGIESVTGESYSDLTSAVQGLKNGYGQGGGEENQLHATLDGTLTSIDSNVSKIIDYACRGLSELETLDIPNATSIGAYAFYSCKKLISVNAPNVKSIGTYAFYGCSELTDIIMPKVSSLGTYAFYKCDLRSINFPDAAGITQNAFFQNQNLQRADFGVANKINQAAFANCSKLDTLILRLTSGICTLGTANSSLQNTPIANGTGYVYVPSSLIENYKVATNWVNYANQFRAIEDYPDICGG